MNSALSLALSPLLPTPEQTRLLRACLWQGERAREAWVDLQRRGPDLIRLLRHGPADVRRLAPLLFVALRDAGSAVDGGLHTVLRTAYLREEIRSKEYRRVCGTVISELTAARIPFIVVRGAALSETVYGDPALRHSHDLNLLLPPAEAGAATQVLTQSGCRAREEKAGGDARVLDHQSGLPVLLHSRLFRVSFYDLPWELVWDRSGRGEIAGHTVRLLSASDTLLHASYQALHSVRAQPFGWAADASLILRRSPDIDWAALLHTAEQSRTQVSLALALDYLVGELAAPVPDCVTARLATATETVDPLQRDVALLASRRSNGLPVRSVWGKTSTLRAKLTVLRWFLLPSRGYLEWASGAPLTAGLPRIYCQRLGQYVARRAAKRFHRPRGARRGLDNAKRGHPLPADPGLTGVSS